MYRVKFNLKRMAEKLLLMSKCCQIIKIVFEKKNLYSRNKGDNVVSHFNGYSFTRDASFILDLHFEVP